MARSTKATTNTPIPSANADEWEWENVVEASPSRVIFDTIGDEFIGQFIGEEEIDPGTGEEDVFSLYLFRGRDGELYGINKSYKLAQAMDKIEPGSWVKIQYVKDINTGRGLNPMKDFRIDVRK